MRLESCALPISRPYENTDAIHLVTIDDSHVFTSLQAMKMNNPLQQKKIVLGSCKTGAEDNVLVRSECLKVGIVLYLNQMPNIRLLCIPSGNDALDTLSSLFNVVKPTTLFQINCLFFLCLRSPTLASFNYMQRNCDLMLILEQEYAFSYYLIRLCIASIPPYFLKTLSQTRRYIAHSSILRTE